jgi:hypothetical protein
MKQGDGYERFVTSEAVRRLKDARLPEIEKEWMRLPASFRALLYRNAGIGVGRVSDGLRALTMDERRGLQAALSRLSELQAKASRLLIGAVDFRTRG